MADLNEFFNKLHEKTWRDHVDFDVSNEFNKFVEYINDNRDLIIEDVIDSINKMQAIKLEGMEEFTYDVYKKWLTKFMSSYMIEKLDKYGE